VLAVQPGLLAGAGAGGVKPGKMADDSSWPLAACAARNAQARKLAAQSRTAKDGFVEGMKIREKAKGVGGDYPRRRCCCQRGFFYFYG
jgi:hypothetical protein